MFNEDGWPTWPAIICVSMFILLMGSCNKAGQVAIENERLRSQMATGNVVVKKELTPEEKCREKASHIYYGKDFEFGGCLIELPKMNSGEKAPDATIF